MGSIPVPAGDSCSSNVKFSTGPLGVICGVRAVVECKCNAQSVEAVRSKTV